MTKLIQKKPLSIKARSIISLLFLSSLVTLVVLVLLARFVFYLKPFRVIGEAMSPTISNRDLVLTSQNISNIEHGDIVIFHYPNRPNDVHVMRIIALPGETLSIDKDGNLYINKQLQKESYVSAQNNLSPQVISEQKLEAGHYWVMGDNRDHSHDSRDWGPLTEDFIVSKIIWRYWPPVRFGSIY